MTRFAFVPLILLAFSPFTEAKRIAAPPNPVQRALQAEAVLIGKVTAIEKELVEVAESKDSPKVPYKVAVIKVESALSGLANLTHVKVGLPAAAGGPGRGRGPVMTLEANQEGLFFLTKHPSGQFYTFNWMTSPVDVTAENYKASVTNIKRAYAAIAEPAKALKAEKVDDRTFAALAIIMKVRTMPQTGGEIGLEKLPADESKLILKALAEANWSKFDPSLPPPTNAFYMLGLTTEDGWAPPKPGQPGTNFNDEMQKAFAKWVDGAGKDYRINKFIVKK